MAETVSAPTKTEPAPKLDEVMMAMDVVDTLRHQDALVERELGQSGRDEALKKRLREIYEGQGLEVNDRILDQGIAALKESRFVYEPPKPGFNLFLARLWVRRRSVGIVAAIVLVAIVALVGWRLWDAGEAQRLADAQELELTVTLPEALQEAGAAALAAATADAAKSRVEAAIAEGQRAVDARDGEAMRDSIAELQAMRAELEQTYDLTVVARPGEQSGVFRIPDANEDARNYYLIVEAIDPDGEALSLPIYNEENQQTETVSKWAVRVTEEVYEAVGADKADDGIVQNPVVGTKPKGSFDVDYDDGVGGGAITRW